MLDQKESKNKWISVDSSSLFIIVLVVVAFVWGFPALSKRSEKIEETRANVISAKTEWRSLRVGVSDLTETTPSPALRPRLTEVGDVPSDVEFEFGVAAAPWPA